VVRVPVWVENFSRHHRVQTGSQPPIQWVPGALSLGAKRLEREADYLPPSSAEVKNEWSYTSTPPHALIAWCSVKVNTTETVQVTKNLLSKEATR
jgi:hypothetical protein